ncbi:aromatic-ring-hydroxylating dioxygenase subunit beta [Bacillus sp. ISL-53]|uniref:aromatic-ring-hydroxylating dioxygenase subunit beta n=1 Tax=unclassified Bacillus (in: firmicutes) TaxID=185979 RepID=UPI001BE5039C|nr:MULTISPECIES: aromatic-ring-hydroxylating dioxygenase subunit beta [unclassified Bacillus (in: firmicutes)]MBT2605204.1 aromatic-ring-hydroxylating dioxygenase subunit beta [Bacillus sp. ISL-53]MBT2613900.1 aromatic-ring-hydroxylating dioxygenase subunit beta [Bacillus sp. ISL-78]MBT2627779.1 aromatic-ring-hydroxylating dioxygenase subunit beta [Bacillus sp. ISL-101]MBT2717496.1 aromatic-ring-hydroxylating dioxygenase subunit beta [Bacillus sp. ISL-57]
MIQTKNELKQIEAILFKEARYINENRLDEWLELFTNNCVYWVPCNENDIDPETHVSIIYDDRKRLEERVWRLQTGLAYGQQPQSKTRHLITNVEIVEELKDKVVVSSNFLLVELRRGVQTIFSGRNEHHLCLEGNNLKIHLKKIELLNNNEPLGNLSFIL